MFTQGGRAGDVLFVTNLRDYRSGQSPIEGSLRAAVEAEGPRTIVFRVSGNIELVRTLEIKNPFVTIAGQSAPGDGVTIKNYGIDVEAPEVIIRYLRVRPGDVAGEEVDAINIRSSNVVVDHCSASWGTDETVSVIGEATNVTVQWCIIAESLNESVHSKGEHGYGSLISTSGDVSIHHTIYAFHKSRNPRPRHPLLDFRNNVIYGWGDRAGYNEDDRTRMNYVRNLLLPLPYSQNARYAFIPGGTDSRLFVHGNVLRSADGRVFEDWALIDAPDGIAADAVADLLGAAQPFPAPSVTTHSVDELLDVVLEGAGATRPGRDAADRRVVTLIRDRDGRLIDSQDEVGGWPDLESGALPEDQDADAMPDVWEERHGLDPADRADHAGDLDEDGYTNLEEYLNETDPTISFGWVDPPVLRPGSGTVFTQAPLFATVDARETGIPVRYTTDGTEPTPESPVHDGTIRVFDDAHVRVKAQAGDRPTTAAFAAYDLVEWISAAGVAPTNVRPGLRYAIFKADDWDEGVVLDDLDPQATGTRGTVDFGVRPDGGHNAVVFDGWLDVAADGIYSFYLRDDERSELRLDGRVITQGRPASAAPDHVALRKGLYRFHLRSLHEEPRESSLEWSGPGFDRGPIEPQFLLVARDW